MRLLTVTGSVLTEISERGLDVEDLFLLFEDGLHGHAATQQSFRFMVFAAKSTSANEKCRYCYHFDVATWMPLKFVRRESDSFVKY